jgi:hypothetical protein
MCTAVALGWAGLALGAASAGAQAIGQRQQAKQQAALQAQASRAEQLRKQQEQTSIRMRQMQEEKALAEEMNRINLRTQKGVQRDIVERGERGGISGMATQVSIGDWFRQQGAVSKGLLQQQGFGQTATALALEQSEFASRQRQIGINQPISSPSGFSSALSIASGALSGYSAGMQAGSGMGGGGSSVDTSLNIPKDLAAQYGYKKIR